MKDIYISDITYSLGSKYSINSIEGHDDKKALLTSIGIQNFCKSDKTAQELALDAANQTLSKSRITKSSISAVFYTSTFQSINDTKDAYLNIDSIISEHGLKNAYPYGLFLSNCSNLSMALKMAHDHIQSGTGTSVLVILADKLDDDSKRFMDSSESILSDGALAFIVSEEVGEFKLNDIQLRYDSQGSLKSDNVLTYLEENMKQIKGLWDSLTTPHEEIKMNFIGNYNLLIVRNILNTLKVPVAKVNMQTREEIGHPFGIDTFINLVKYGEEAGFNSADKFRFITSGYFKWGAFELERISK